MANWRVGPQPLQPFEAGNLPSDVKKQLVLDLLEEFGAQNVSVRGNEIYHSCNLPPPTGGHHSNGDRNPSAHVNFEKLTFKCWTCGGGGFLWWIATMRGDNDAQARDWLIGRTGAGGVQNTDDLIAFLDSITKVPEIQERIIPTYDLDILRPWAFIHPYLTEFRKIPEQNVIASNVGYGLLSIRRGDGQFVQSERITIPHFWKGQLVGWQSRRLTDDGTDKYISTPSFPKDLSLYNWNPHASSVVIVESPMSVIAQRHNHHMEATFGASVTVRQMDLIAQHEGDLVLWMDNDPAGWKATEDLCEYLSTRTSRLFVIDSPYAADPADFDSDTFAMALVDWRVHWSLWQRPRTLMEWRRPDVDQEVRSGGGAQG